MQAEKFNNPMNERDPSLGAVLEEIGTSVKDLVRSEVNLIQAEIQESSRILGRHSAETAVFGALAAISVLPLLAFLVIGLGDLMGDRYWLSSLIVAAVCAVIGGMMASRAYERLKSQDLSLPRTRRSLGHERDTVSDKIEDIKNAAKRRSA